MQNDKKAPVRGWLTGKFAPLHAGHINFIQQAATQCDELDSAMERGFQITSIRLLDESGFEFTLTDEFRLARIKWPASSTMMTATRLPLAPRGRAAGDPADQRGRALVRAARQA